MLKSTQERFIENKGQWDSRAEFLAKSQNLDLWVTKDGVVMDHYRPVTRDGKEGVEGHVVKMRFADTSGSTGFRTGKKQAPTDYILSREKTRAQSYSEVTGKNVYPGIDARHYFDGGQPRYDLVVRPGANPGKIQLDFHGAKAVSAHGTSLTIKTSIGEIKQQGLFAYQMVNGSRKPVKAAFKKIGATSVGIDLGRYDASRTLVIDPLVYGSYYGGDNGFDEVRGVAADADGGVYLTGYTQATRFPAIQGPYGFTVVGQDAFISKFQGDAYGHDYSAIIGGSGTETGMFVQIDHRGDVWVVGTTNSANFPGHTGNVRGQDIFMTRFAKSPTLVLDPLPTRTLILGGTGDDFPSGFAIVPNEDPLSTGPVQFAVSGSAGGGTAMDVIGSGANSSNGYVYRGTYDSGVFNVSPSLSTFMGGSVATNTRGVVADAEGSIYVVGTIGNQGVVDTSINPVFLTTPGVFPNGRLLRGNDAFVRKYDFNGGLVYSAVLGGNGDDSGLGIAVDTVGNAYLTGIASSFNFPRTIGVYGENFRADAMVYVTKVNRDGSQLIYSTHLNTSNAVIPRGIAVDLRGVAYVAGVMDFGLSFPNPPGDPNEPNGVTPGSIPITGDAIDPLWEYPQTPELPTGEGFLLALNPTATSLLYGTYLGGILDEQVFAPYTDRVGDVWVVGSTDSFRRYVRVSSTGAQTIYQRTGSLPEALLSEFAFKRNGDANGDTPVNGVLYGLRESPFTSPAVLNGVIYRRDGFVVKMRLSLPTIQSITMTPDTIAGGLGASSNGLITLSSAAPSGGLDVVVNLNNAAASFSPSSPQDTLTLTIPAGGTTAAFTVYSNPVTDNTQVQVRATLEGNFKIAQLNITPWLQQLTVTPTTVVGGNQVVGRVRLFQNAPVGGAVVQLLTDTSGIVSFPGGNTVTVPEGLDTATFLIDTAGVSISTQVPVTATLLGVGRTQNITVQPASLSTLTFNPVRVSGGSTAIGTVRLNGKVGAPFTVDLSLPVGTPAGYVLTPVTLNFATGDTEKTFQLATAYEAVNTQRTVTATRQAQGNYPFQSIQGTLFVDAVDLISFTIDRSSIGAGQTAIGTIVLGKAAGTGGVVVNISANSSSVSVPPTVTVAAGDTTATFNITTAGTTNLGDQVVTITASRGPVSIARQLIIESSTMGLAINPGSVVGGNSATGTVSVSAPAPAGGLLVSLASNAAAAVVPGSVTIPAGATSATFPITTTDLGTTVTATITATLGPLTANALLEVRASTVASVRFSPSIVKGGRQTQCVIRLETPAPAGGAVVDLQNSLPLVANIPTQVTVPAGEIQYSFTVTTFRVSRTRATQVTASRGGSSVSTILTVRR